MKLPLYVQAARDSENVAASAENLVNYYAEKASGDAVTAFNLKVVLAEESFASTGQVLPRAVAEVNGTIYAVFNNRLWSIAPQTGNAQDLASVTGSADTSISSNGTDITIAAGGDYYVWDGSSISSPGSGLLTSVGSVEFFDQYTVLTEKDGQRFEWTDVADATSRDATNFATADGRDDVLLRPVAFGRVLYLFGTRSVEAWYNTGAAGANAFTRLAGGVLDDGLKAYKLVVKADDGIFFVADDNTAKFLAGNNIVTVSTPPVHTDIKASTPTNVYTYEDRGQTFFVIRFSDRPAWVFSFETQLWHRRDSGPGMAWGTLETVRASNDWHAFDASGEVYRLRRVSQDASRALRRVCVTKPLYFDGKKFSVRKLQFLCRTGKSNLGRNAKVQLRVSDNGGLTWKGPIEGVIGDQGEYHRQIEFYALGRYEQFNAELVVSDAADITVYSDANVELG